MKKAYISPETLLTVIATQQMIADSGNNYGKPEQGQDLSTAETTTETSGNLSRRTIWDDEELDEEGF